VVLLALMAALAVPATRSVAQDARYLRFAAGSVGGTSFPVASQIANLLSSPPGLPECGRGGTCGVPGVIVVTQATAGSLESADLIGRGQVDIALIHDAVARWAIGGTGPFRAKPPVPKLRAIANLYAEELHAVVRWESLVTRLPELHGRTVGVSELGSMGYEGALLALEAYGMGPRDVTLQPLPLDRAADRLRDGTIDALFALGGQPVDAIARLGRLTDIRLVPIDGPERGRLMLDYPLIDFAVIRSGAYPGTEETPTIGFDAQLMVSADMPEDLAYAITRSLWHPASRALLDGGHPAARQIQLARALDNLGAPLHPGAERYYRENGRLN
jgi:TRAP transporter TAXI family solute receptor